MTEGEKFMRSVTIRRNKSFVGCMVSAKIYVEDLMYGDTKINDTPCRKLGELKNGQEETYQVSEDAVKIFVIADKVSKGFCSEFYQLPEGTGAVTLTGQNRFSLTSGNAFRFDNNTDPAALANRKKGNKKGIWVLILAVIVGAIIGGLSGAGVFDGSAEPKTFTKDGMSVTLTDAFKETEAEGYDVAYESKKEVVFAQKESFDLAEGFGDLTVEEYAELVLEANESNEEIKSEDGLLYFEYDATGDNKVDYHYYAFFYKANDAFWMVQMATYKNKAQDARPQIMEWAKSVSFSG